MPRWSSTSDVGASSPSTCRPSRSTTVTCSGSSSASTPPVGVMATSVPLRALTLPDVPSTSPSAASRLLTSATCARSCSKSTAASYAETTGALAGGFVEKFDSRMDELDLTRRELLAAGAVAGAGTLAGPAVADAARRRRRPARRHADVVVIGAGLAGLTAARELMRDDRSVVLLEARNRVGGRVLNKPIGGGEHSEAGGTFAGPTQDHILELAEQMGVGTFPTYNTGDNIYFADGTATRYSDSGPTGTAPPDPTILADLATVVTRLDEMSKDVPVDAPWESASAGDWDSQTLQQWI